MPDSKLNFDIEAQLRREGLLNSDGTFWNPSDALASTDPYEYHADVWRLFQAMLSKDGQIYAMDDVAAQAVLSLEEVWNFEPCGGEKGEITKFWKSLITGKESVFYKLREDLARAIGWGIALSEIIWEPEGAGWRPVKTVPIPAWWYKLDTDNLPHKVSMENFSVDPNPLPEDSYAMFIYKGDLIRPYGRGHLSLCYRPYLKKMLYDYNRIEVAQRYVNPHLILLGPKKNVDETAGDLVNKLSKDIWGIYGDAATMRFDVMYPEGDKAMAAYERGWAAEDREIAKIATGAVLVTEEAEHGTRAQAEVMLVPYLARAFERAGGLEAILQYYIDLINRVRFGDNAARPDYAIKTEVPEDKAQMMTMLKDAAMALGLYPDPNWVEQFFGFPLEKAPEIGE